MFRGSSFNQDIGGWNTEKVENMSSMFERSVFNRNISEWDIGNIIDLSNMFYNSGFYRNLYRWVVQRPDIMINAGLLDSGLLKYRFYNRWIEYDKSSKR
jgi:surface protein